MDTYQNLNELLIYLFTDILDIEEKALLTEEFKDITINDMHILEAVGKADPKNMSAVAKVLSITVGTLTIAINNLVKKGYALRVRSEDDRRVVLLSLTKKGQKAYALHMKFHNDMIQAAMDGLSEEEAKVLAKTIENLKAFFHKYREP